MPKTGTYKRILGTTAPEALKRHLPVGVELRRSKWDDPDEYVIEGPTKFKKLIDKAVELFNSDCE